MARHSVLNAADVGSASRTSASVASGWAVISAARRRSSASANARRRNLVCCRGASDPVSRRRWISRCTHARLTSYFAATLSAAIPVSHARATRCRKSIEYAAMAPPATEVPRRPYYVQPENALGSRKNDARERLSTPAGCIWPTRPTCPTGPPGLVPVVLRFVRSLHRYTDVVRLIFRQLRQ